GGPQGRHSRPHRKGTLPGMPPTGTDPRKPLGVVLAGGLSRRMGRDKATLALAGRSLLDRSIDALIAAGLPVLVVGRSALARGDVQACEDDEPGRGPLAGLATALRRAQGAPIVAVPCDVPDLDAEAVR